MLDPLYIQLHQEYQTYPQYGKCSKILNTSISLFLNKMLIIKVGIHKIVINIANSEDPDQRLILQKQSDLSLH